MMWFKNWGRYVLDPCPHVKMNFSVRLRPRGRQFAVSVALHGGLWAPHFRAASGVTESTFYTVWVGPLMASVQVPWLRRGAERPQDGAGDADLSE